VRRSILAALSMSAAFLLSACGATILGSSSAPATFSITTTTPTSTVPTPSTQASLGPNGIPIETGQFLASATTTRLGAIVDGIQCQSFSQLAYTAYAHLQVYVGGSSRALPGGIGIVGLSPEPTQNGLFFGSNTCMYWLHTRASDGLIEAESPKSRRFTLGDFFKIWAQPLSRHERSCYGDRKRLALDRPTCSHPT
jgi:hypothetical protein